MRAIKSPAMKPKETLGEETHKEMNREGRGAVVASVYVIQIRCCCCSSSSSSSCPCCCPFATPCSSRRETNPTSIHLTNRMHQYSAAQRILHANLIACILACSCACIFACIFACTFACILACTFACTFFVHYCMHDLHGLMHALLYGLMHALLHVMEVLPVRPSSALGGPRVSGG